MHLPGGPKARQSMREGDWRGEVWIVHVRSRPFRTVARRSGVESHVNVGSHSFQIHDSPWMTRLPYPADTAPGRTICSPLFRGGLRAPAARSGTRAVAAGLGGLRGRRQIGLRVLSHHQHRFAALRHGRRGLGGNRGHRQRRPGRHRAVHGRGNHAQPGGGAKRRLRLPAQGSGAEEGIRAGRHAAASGAALHAGADHADGADRGVQPAPFGGAATVPLAAVEPGPVALERADHDPGVDRQHAGRAPRRRHGGRRTACRRPG